MIFPILMCLITTQSIWALEDQPKNVPDGLNQSGIALSVPPIYTVYNSDAGIGYHPVPVILTPLSPLAYTFNTACTSSSGLSGICMPNIECLLIGGTNSGPCGILGACCTNLVTTCGSKITRNTTYWQSPTSVSTNQACSLTVHFSSGLLQPTICQVRLDMKSFSIAQPDQSSSVCTDKFQVTGTSNSVPVICGDNSGQHMYLTPLTSTTDMIFTFTFDSTQSVTRSWNIQISLLPCGASYLAPSNCLQYFQGSSSGAIQSFNFKNTAPSTAIRQIGNQDYSICLRQEKGYCSTCYTPCTSTSASFPFSLSGDASTAGNPAPLTGTGAAPSCLLDYVIIAGGYNKNDNTKMADRFCGTGLNSDNTATTSTTVCSNVKPFSVWYHSDSIEATATPIDKGNLGFCLNYQQQSC